MKKLLNKIKELYKKSSLFRIIIILLIGALIIFEGKNIYVDRYNFQQLEKAKKVVEKFEKSGKKLALPVYSLDDFNYGKGTDFLVGMGADIEPLDKRYCYYVYYDFDKENNKPVFEFGFKLHSLLYKLLYMSDNYAYPKPIKPVKLPEDCKKEFRPLFPFQVGRGTRVTSRCLGGKYESYLRIINNPCEK